MSFKEVLENYMKDKDSEADISFLENILKEHEAEVQAGNSAEEVTRLNGEIEKIKSEKEESERAWRQKYRDAFFQKGDGGKGTSNPNEVVPEDEGDGEGDKDPFEEVLKGVKYLK